MTEPTCPRCGSTNWRCWDERIHEYEHKVTKEGAEFPVGFMACNDCQASWMDHDLDLNEWHHLGRWDEDLEEWRD